MPPTTKYRRVLLKVSGEALMGSQSFGIDTETVDRIAADVHEAIGAGAQICMVIGGGNIFRGLAGAAKGIERATADYMGMLATVMNALAMQAALERVGVASRVQSAIPMSTVCEPYIRRRAIRHMEKGRGGDLRRRHRQSLLHDRHGGGAPGRRDELRRHAQGHPSRRRLLRRPEKDPKAERYDLLSYHEVLARDLQVMDAYRP